MLMLAYWRMLTQQTVHKQEDVAVVRAEDEADANFPR